MHDAHIDIRLRKNIKSKMTRTSWSAGCIRRKFVKAALLCALQINMAVAHFILAHIVSLLRGIGISWAPATLHWNSLASWHSRSVFLRICPTLFIDHGHGARKLYMPYIYTDSWFIFLNRKCGTPKKAYAYSAFSLRFDNFPCKPFTKPWIHPWSTLPSTAWAEWQPVPWLVRCQMSPQLADCMATFGGWRIPGTHEGVSLHSFLGVGCAAPLRAVSAMYAPFMLISMWEN